MKKILPIFFLIIGFSFLVQAHAKEPSKKKASSSLEKCSKIAAQPYDIVESALPLSIQMSMREENMMLISCFTEEQHQKHLELIRSRENRETLARIQNQNAQILQNQEELLRRQNADRGY